MNYEIKVSLDKNKSGKNSNTSLKKSKNNMGLSKNSIGVIKQVPKQGLKAFLPSKMFAVKTAALLGAAKFIGSNVITYQEAKTGNTLEATNNNNALKTILSGGTNVAIGAIRNELFVKKRIQRQNYELDYSQKLYNRNNFGDKYKVR